MNLTAGVVYIPTSTARYIYDGRSSILFGVLVAKSLISPDCEKERTRRHERNTAMATDREDESVQKNVALSNVGPEHDSVKDARILVSFHDLTFSMMS